MSGNKEIIRQFKELVRDLEDLTETYITTDDDELANQLQVDMDQLTEELVDMCEESNDPEINRLFKQIFG